MRSHRRTRLAPLSVALLCTPSLVSLSSAALHAQSTETFQACYVPGSGTVYRIGAPGLPADCLATEHSRFTWNPLSTAGGDLGGSFPNPTVARLQGRPIASTAPTQGQVLTFNGTAWAPAAPPSSPAGATVHGQLSGLNADDHPQYLLANGVRNATNGFVVTGTLGSGQIPATGDGVRLMWYPGKAALRAGMGGPVWDDENIGRYSLAVGLAAMARGVNSTAIGNSVSAVGAYSVAMGIGSRAIGDRTLALSGGEASGNSAIAIGSTVTASGDFSLAIGSSLAASGTASFVLGTSASANGRNGAFVYGDASTAATLDVLRASRDNQFAVRAQHFWLGTGSTATNPTNHFLTTSTGAHLTTGGAWTNSSDVRRKEHFLPLDGGEVLEKLSGLSIRSWQYRDEPGVRHVGPTAQEFHAAFGLGGDETAIATIDADGVTMLAVQALAEQTRRIEEENAALRAAVAELRAEIAELRSAR